ncbi:MFS transporter [Providencia sp. PROV149]|uniref:MFS transporter n=1 Tax=Providencia sp. PROV149 TaxID=2949859 RepID=UPI0023491F27|nr:MFS transporter [Providencia sp. PROV149]
MTAPQVGFFVSIYVVVIAISGLFITLLLGGFNRKTILLAIKLLFWISHMIYALTDRYDVI